MDKIKQNLSSEAFANLEIWLTHSKYSQYQSELKALIDQESWDELEDRFFKNIEFGTAGMRGKVGAGVNRINQITIGAAAQGLAQFLLKSDKQAREQGVVIAYDTRNSSQELAEYASRVIVGNGLKACLFDGFRATPELSFAVRHLNASAGIVISASHNPPQDNGFKAYTNYGGQLTSPNDKAVMEEVLAVEEVKVGDLSQVNFIGAEIDEAYYQAVLDGEENAARQIKIVYSPLHGAGQASVLPVLRRAGFEVSEVVAQMTPDGNFPSVPNNKPNPEEDGANIMATEQMLSEGADLAITTDPDADRLSVIINHHGKAITINGNQSASLILNYVIKNHKAIDPYVCKTIVTTDMISAIANKYHVEIYQDIPVGFKFIGELIEGLQKSGKQFLAGGEESYGVLVGTHARDKDAASGALVIAKYADELKKRGKTLFDELLTLYEEFGVYQEALATAEFTGASGFVKMQNLMKNLRAEPLREIAGAKITTIHDYQTMQKINLITGEKTAFDFRESSNVLAFELGDERNRLVIRPSGTEPKIKLYLKRYEPVNPYADVQTQSEVTQTNMKRFLDQAKEILLK